MIVNLNLDLHLFILAGAIEGCGGFSAILAASFAYVSDISSGKWRTLRIDLVESMTAISGRHGGTRIGRTMVPET